MQPEATSMEPNAFYNMDGQSARCPASSASTLRVVMRELENESGYQEQQLFLFAPNG
jgi:hypothetical protein